MMNDVMGGPSGRVPFRRGGSGAADDIADAITGAFPDLRRVHVAAHPSRPGTALVHVEPERPGKDDNISLWKAHVSSIISAVESMCRELLPAGARAEVILVDPLPITARRQAERLRPLMVLELDRVP